MLPECQMDLWETLQRTKKNIVLYGMGNGADKILDGCQKKGIAVSGVFASDGFVRQKLFHGMPVTSWGQIKEQFGAENVIVLVSFGTSREDVLENIFKISTETELYAPDVPAFGDGLFDRNFYQEHQEELESARSLLSDEESKRIFDNVLMFKLTGRISYLLAAESDADKIWDELVEPCSIRNALDLGAYNGDSAKELIERGKGSVKRIEAMEPDMRNYKKLLQYANGETRCEVIAHPLGAWEKKDTLQFDNSGNRNASLRENRSQTLAHRPTDVCSVCVDSPDSSVGDLQIDYIKYDVEGAEREALNGSKQTILRDSPTLLVSLYHRNEDLFALPLQIHRQFPQYRGFYLRRLRGIPAWDLNLYVKRAAKPTG